jgi:5-oxoprolinase (ATP-hydrolysing)
MGETLRRLSHSTNMKERLDFSCALFDANGRLLANAPHIPVHLGAMGESVRAILTARAGRLRPGEAYATNDPFHGGSHLPDVTVVSPVFAPNETRPSFLVASRGHHADMGGITPGSMPAFSRSIDQEGVRFHDVCVLSNERLCESEVRTLLGSGPLPVRNVEERLADLRAQIAANARGEHLLIELAEKVGLAKLKAYAGHVRANAADAMRAAIGRLPDGQHRFEDALDDGSEIVCTIQIAGDHAQVDFGGTAAQHPGNLNAPRGVVVAAVLYSFRTLLGRDLPLNDGCLDPIELRIPNGSLLDPKPPAACVGGNVETSQRLVDVVLGALGVAAASQGTMNNLTLGDASFGYYETIAGGAGAGPGFAGQSAVHTHMTNTRITDVEVLERRHPLILRRFAIRRGSGGEGRYPGGDGVVRELEATAPLTASLLTERRDRAPFGLAGGGSGKPGCNRLVRPSGEERDLGGKARLELEPGDRLVIETPGGGGFGRPG